MYLDAVFGVLDAVGCDWWVMTIEWLSANNRRC